MHGTAQTRMTSQERCDLVLAFARVLYVNGQATEQIKSASERLALTEFLSRAVYCEG